MPRLPKTPCFSVYLLTPQHAELRLRKTYIGKSVDPFHRRRQHNGEIAGGARRTKRYRPWEIVCVVTGFVDEIAALRFEWIWQHPYKSKLTRDLLSEQIKGRRGVGAQDSVKRKLLELHTILSAFFQSSSGLSLHFVSKDVHKEVDRTSFPRIPPCIDVLVGTPDFETLAQSIKETMDASSQMPLDVSSEMNIAEGMDIDDEHEQEEEMENMEHTQQAKKETKKNKQSEETQMKFSSLTRNVEFKTSTRWGRRTKKGANKMVPQSILDRGQTSWEHELDDCEEIQIISASTVDFNHQSQSHEEDPDDEHGITIVAVYDLPETPRSSIQAKQDESDVSFQTALEEEEGGSVIDLVTSPFVLQPAIDLCGEDETDDILSFDFRKATIRV